MTSDYANPEEFGLADLLCCAASREVQDNEIVFAGTGLPMVAIMLAQKTHAPNLKLIFEAGTLDGRPPEIPTSVGDARCEMGASRASGLHDAFSIAQRGYVDLGFLGGAEVDEYGNVNTTCIGDYLNPELRLTGSGGRPVSSATIQMLRQSLRTGRFGVVRFPPETLAEAGELLDRAIASHLHRPVKSLAFLREMEPDGG